jgi:trehalose 6-phosphate synthase
MARARNRKKEKGDNALVVVANRLPVRRTGRKGSGAWEISPGGLVSALKPFVIERGATWIGWTGIAGSAPAPFDFDGLHLHPVALSRPDMEGFYHGFSNRTLWPLYHDAVRWPEYHREWWAHYLEVNRRFAETTAEVAAPNALVWIHDYHLQLVPSLIRNLRPDLRIGFFLHVPFPPQELFAQLPWRRQILEGMLGADLVGFQTDAGRRNFAQLARRYLGIAGSHGKLRFHGRRVTLGAFPVSIDFRCFEELAAGPEVREAADTLRRKLGQGRHILLGVDRLDYTKGIDIRLKAFHEALMRGDLSVENCVLVQVAVPSRENVTTYSDLKAKIEALVGRINGDFGEVGRSPVHYLHRSLSPHELVALYRLADVMLVTPLRDGMNLVAKEYVASRINDTGVLILSEFTGSALELRSALLVNPHDVDGLSAAYARALRMPRSEMTRRMRRLRSVVKAHDVIDWGESFLRALET